MVGLLGLVCMVVGMLCLFMAALTGEQLAARVGWGLVALALGCAGYVWDLSRR